MKYVVLICLNMTEYFNVAYKWNNIPEYLSKWNIYD